MILKDSAGLSGWGAPSSIRAEPGSGARIARQALVSLSDLALLELVLYTLCEFGSGGQILAGSARAFDLCL